MKKQKSFTVVGVITLSYVFVTLLLKPVLAEREHNELTPDENRQSQIRGNKVVVFVASSELEDQIKDGRGTQEMLDDSVSSLHEFAYRLRGSNYAVAHTSAKKAKRNILARERKKEPISSQETDSAVYDFGRRHKLQSERFQSNIMVSDKTNTTGSSEVKTRNSSKYQTSSRKKRKVKTRLDVDVEFLESFLLSKQNKRKENDSINTSATKQDIFDEDLKRFLESSNDQSYMYSSVPTSIPTTFSYEASTVEPTTSGEVPTLSEYFIHAPFLIYERFSSSKYCIFCCINSPNVII